MLSPKAGTMLTVYVYFRLTEMSELRFYQISLFCQAIFTVFLNSPIYLFTLGG